MRLLEREKHRALLRSLVGECLTGRGQVVLVEGVAASGRTALLDEAVDDAERAGLTAMRASCSPMEKDLAGSVLSQLLHSIPAPGELADHAAPGYHEFCLQILRLAERGPLVLAVDDMHHADAESARCLLYLARRLGAARVLLLVTCQRDEDQPPHAFIDELRGMPGTHQLDVKPLTRSGTAALLAERLGELAGTPGLAAEFHRISGGNLRLLHALVEDCRACDGIDRDRVTVGGYGAAVVALLRRWEPAVMRTAQVLAVLGGRGTPDRAARLAGLDQEAETRAEAPTGAAVERATATMTAAGVLLDGLLPHPAAREAVLATVTGSERAVLNQRAARLLHTLGEAAPTVACHLAASRRPVEPWAVGVLAEAAEQELLAGGNARAARYLELAHEACRGPAERATVLAKLSEAEWQCGPSAAARHLTSLVAAARTGDLGPDHLPGLVRQLLWHGRHSDARSVLDRLRDAAASDAPLAHEVRNLDAWLAFSHPQHAHRRVPSPASAPFGDPQAARTISALPGSDPWLALAASLCEQLVSGRADDRAGSLERSLHNIRPHGNTPWAHETTALALLGLIDLGRYDLVLERCAALSESGDAEQSPTWHAMLAARSAEALLRRGDLAGALRDAQRALTLLPSHAWGVTIGHPLGTLLTAAVRLGDVEAADRYLAFSPPEAMFQSHHGLHYLHARGEYHLAAQRTYAALSDFLACGDLVQALGLEAAPPVPWRTSAAQAWLRLGNNDRAHRMVREQLACSDMADGGGASRGRSLRTLAAISSPERRPQLLLEAVELFEQRGEQYEQARVLADLGYAYSALADSRRARTTLRRARYLALSCGAAPLCEELLAFEGASDLSSPCEEDDGTRLTESERRVAHLAVLGYTNREIAAKLYITASTVEQHLTRVYRKLDIKRRKDLPADLGITTLRSRQRRSQQRSAS